MENNNTEKVILQGSVEVELNEFIQTLRKSDATNTTQFNDAIKLLVSTYKKYSLENSQGINLSSEVAGINLAMESILNNIYAVSKKVETYKSNATSLVTQRMQDIESERKEHELILENKVSTYENKIEEFKNKNSELSLIIEELRRNNKELTSTVTTLEKEKVSNMKELEEVKIEKNNANLQLSKALADVEKMIEIEKENQELKSILSQLKEAKMAIDNNIEKLTEKVASQEEKLKEANVIGAENKKIAKELNDANIVIAKLNDKVASQEEKLKEAAVVITENKRLSKELNDANIVIADIKAKIKIAEVEAREQVRNKMNSEIIKLNTEIQKLHEENAQLKKPKSKTKTKAE